MGASDGDLGESHTSRGDGVIIVIGGCDDGVGADPRKRIAGKGEREERERMGSSDQTQNVDRVQATADGFLCFVEGVRERSNGPHLCNQLDPGVSEGAKAESFVNGELVKR